MSFDRKTRAFGLEFQHDDDVTAPTEAFVTDYQYPQGYHVEVPDGAYDISLPPALIELRAAGP